MKTVAEELGVTVGSFFYSNWGYEQTNIDFYKVVGVTAKGVKLQKWTSRHLSNVGNFTQDAVVPGNGPRMCWHEDGSQAPVQPFQKMLKSYPMGDRINVYVDLTSYSSASPWDGSTKYATASGYGH